MQLEVNDDLQCKLDRLVDQGFAVELPDKADALAILQASDEETLEIVAAAGKVRRKFFANRIKLNYLVNMKSGLCPEDCNYCSQRRGSDADVLKYNWVSPDDATSVVERAVANGAKRVCLVASGRGPSERDVDRVSEMVQAIKEQHPSVEICVSLGLLQPTQAERLHDSGVYAYNHNLNTSAERYEEICSTHTFADRQETVKKAKLGGLSPCSGAIFGMGESDEEVVEVAYSLRALDPDSVPINFLIPFPGTPLEGQWQLTPHRCLRILAMFRFIFPNVEVRVAAGREIHLRTLQPLALHLANSMFLGDYLTSEGQAGKQDLEMIADAGFVIEGQEDVTLPKERLDLVSIRRRGVGTNAPANS